MFDKKETIEIYSGRASYQYHQDENTPAIKQIYELINLLATKFEINMIVATFNPQQPDIFSLKMSNNGSRTILVDGVEKSERENARAVDFLCEMGEVKETIPGQYGNYSSSTGFTIQTEKCERLLEALELLKEQPQIISETFGVLC